MSDVDASYGNILAGVRLAKGYSLEAFAARIRVPVGQWQAFESGSPSVSTAAVTRAALALGVDPDRIDQLSSSDPALAFNHAGVPDFFHADVAELRARLDRARTYRFVLDVLEHRGRLEDQQPQALSVPPYAQGYALARAVRAALGEPINPLPDLKALLEREAGVLVSTHGFTAQSVRGVTAKEPETRAAAVVVAFPLSGHERLLRRVDLAHELAHVLFDAAQATTDIWIDTDEAPSTSIEQRARAFAAELLLPLAAIEAELGPRPTTELSATGIRPTAEVLMRVYRATPDVVANHLTNHRYLAKGEREALAALLTNVPAAPCVEDFRTDALWDAVREAVEKNRMSQARALELLGLSVHEMAILRSAIPA
jgi:transcriptional regulator with XRE-family HTH domain